MTKNESISAPGRSKEEIVGVRSLLDDGVIEAIHSVYQMKVREYDADFRRDTPEGFWQKKYGTNLHSTGLGERWALKEALSQALSTLETPPLHKEGEAVGYVSERSFGYLKSGQINGAAMIEPTKTRLATIPLYAAPVPVPVPVPVTPEAWIADAADGLPLHKRGTTADPETARYWAQTTTVRPLYAAPVPVPVTKDE